MQIISYCLSKSGDVIDETYCSLYHCAEELCEQYGLTREETEKAIRTAIEKGTEFPSGSGFTYDYLLEYSSQRELF